MGAQRNTGHREALDIGTLETAPLKCDDKIHSLQSAFQIHGKFVNYHHLSPYLRAHNRPTYLLLVGPLAQLVEHWSTAPALQRSGACFSKVPKRLGRISGDIILFVSSKRRRLEARNFAVIFIFISFTT